MKLGKIVYFNIAYLGYTNSELNKGVKIWQQFVGYGNI